MRVNNAKRLFDVRILVVEDYEPFRRFLCERLKTRPELQVVGEASDGLEAIQKAEELNPDLVLLDIGLPKLNGIEAAKAIHGRCAKSKILFVTQESDGDVRDTAMQIGAAGYVLKADASHELLEAVARALRNF